MSSENDPIIAEFVIESREHLADIENQLLAIEKAGADIDSELVNTVFRAIHSIKGACGFLGFTSMEALSHSLENVLNQIRNRELVPDSTIVDVMLRGADVLREMIQDIHNSNEVDVKEYVNALDRIASLEQDALPSSGQHEAAGSTEPDTRLERCDGPRPEDKSQSPTSVADAHIRVPVTLLDRLMNLAGELVLSRNQLLQAAEREASGSSRSRINRLDQVTSELQEAIMQTRLQVVGTAFGKVPRVVRDLSAQLGKECRLALEGEEVELDKSIVETIGDPLIHLIRNSIDHGIELPNVRASKGKSVTGTIALKAFHQDGKVNIAISDDGAGIDGAMLREKALARGIITPQQAKEMTDRESVQLIFHPGFSTAEKVTGVSGRGVGMDVVKTNIEKLGGSVIIDTEVGRGTTINIRLPLTLAIIPSLIVRCAGRRFAIPQTNIRELVRIRRKDVASRFERVKDAEVFRLRGKLLPLVRLNTALGIDQHADIVHDSAVNIIVVEGGHLLYGLIVDGLHDSEEIVVKPLGRHMQGCHALAGATILGDGQVAMILDVAGVAAHCQLTVPEENDLHEHGETSIVSEQDAHPSLLFTNHPDEQFAITMDAISRLERITCDRIDTVGGMEVLQFRGTSLPLLSLEKCIRAKSRPEAEKLYIVVFSVLGREIGLIVPRLIDIRSIGSNVDMVTLRQPGVVGLVEVAGRATRLLDPYELTKQAHPEWFAQAKAAFASGQSSSQDPTQKRRILLAEDSEFFRKQVTGFIEEAGYEVVGCEDGLVAWNTLQERSTEFDLVVTDVEMPNMDGCQLARHIRGDPGLSHLPIIALTSLASEEAMQRGMESGIDEYQIKMDRERLMAAVTRYLREIVDGTTGRGQLTTVATGGKR